MHPLSALDPISCGPGTTLRYKSTWAVNTLKIMEQFEPIPIPDQEDPPDIEAMDTGEKQAGADPAHKSV